MGNYEAAHAKQKMLETEMMEAYNADIAFGHYRTLGNSCPSNVTLESGEVIETDQCARDTFYAFSPYFLPLPPAHWMMKIAQDLDEDMMVDLVERDYETSKAKFIECTNALQTSVDAYRRALRTKAVEP